MSFNRTKQQLSISVWVEDSHDSSQYYALPNSLQLSVGDTTITNCFSLELKQVNREDLQQYEITPEIAGEYLIDFIESNTDLVSDYIQNLMNFSIKNGNIEEIESLDSALKEANWTEILAECLEMNPAEMEQNPQLFKAQLHKLLIELVDLINNNTPQIQKAETNTLGMSRIQNILSSHGINLGNSLEELVSLVRQFEENDSIGSSDTNQLRKQFNCFLEIGRDDSQLTTVMEKIVSEYQELAVDEPEFSDVEVEAKFKTEVETVLQDIVQKNPLPTFDFEDLLG